MRSLAAALLLLCTATATADEGKGIDLRDLPPLPTTDETADAGDSSSSIAVVAATLTNEDVVVGAAKREQSLGNVASAVTVISGDRIKRFGYRTVAEALRAVAGIYVVDDHMTPRLGIRGVQLLGDFNTRILVIIDGATVNEPWNQFVGISEDLPVSIDDIDRIEVVRGPVSSVYGTNAFLGIINIVTVSADRSARAYGRTTASGFGTYGGNAGFGVGDVNRQIRGTVQYQNRSGETLTIPEFTQAGEPTDRASNDGIESMNASLVGHWDGAFAQIRAYRRERQLTGAPYTVDVDETRNHNIDQQVLFEGGYTRDIGQVTLTARGYINKYEFSDYLVYEHMAMPNFEDYGDSFWYGAELRAHVKILPRDLLGLTVGAEVTHNSTRSHSYPEGDPEGPDSTDIPNTFHNEGFYAEVEGSPAKWLTLTSGVRYDINSLFENKLSPRAGVLFHAGDRFGLKLLIAQGFRNPSPFEAFFADGSTSEANPNLKPESITSYEAVVWGRPLPGLNLRASAFWWDLTDMLQQLPDPANDLLQFNNVNEIQSRGVELEGTYRTTSGWYGFGTATFSWVDIIQPDGTRDRAPNAPVAVVTGGVSTPRIGGLLHVSTEIEYISERETRMPGLVAAEHLTWNAALVFPGWKHFDLTLGVRNILGTREQIPAQGDYDRNYPQPDGSTTTYPVYMLPGEGTEVYARLGYTY